jgi:hypothetical protein
MKLSSLAVSRPPGMLCYTCPSCAFQTFPIQILRQKKLAPVAVYALFKHHKNCHDHKPLEEVERLFLEDGKDYFRCPQKGCTFIAKIHKSNNNLPANGDGNQGKRICLAKLGRHFMQEHDFPQSQNCFSWNKSHPCCNQGSDSNSLSFFCPRCPFSIPLRSRVQGNLEKYTEFSLHYALHLYDNEGKQLNPQHIATPYHSRPQQL